MPMLPVPAFAALVLAYLALRAFLAAGRPLLVAFLAACAAQSLLVALVLGYDVGGLRPILPVSATFIPPLAWMTFQDALISRVSLRRAVPHGVVPAFALFCRIVAPETMDAVVPLVFTGYGGAILLRLRSASDTPFGRLEAGHVPAALWRVLGWAMIASALSDVLIATAFLMGEARWAGWLITGSSSLSLMLVGLLSASPSAAGVAGDDAGAPPPQSKEANKDDIEIVAALDAFLERDPVHLDPNLTLSRLARRLHLPEKRLSAAVNRATGANVSRYVNSWRIRHACERIEEGAAVTDAMLESGFNTKSNFNREFLRVTGVPPSKWGGGTGSPPKAATTAAGGESE